MSLKVGDIVIFEGVPQLVLRVSDCRAVIRPQRRRPVVIQTRRGERRFRALARETSISPNSDELPRYGSSY